MTIERQGMVDNIKTVILRNFHLTLLDFGVEELFDLATIQTDQMVVMRTFIELKDSFASLEMITLQQSGLLELGQHTIDGGQTDIQVFR